MLQILMHNIDESTAVMAQYGANGRNTKHKNVGMGNSGHGYCI